MADVQYQEPRYRRAAPSDSSPGTVTRIVIRLGLASDEAGAERVLLFLLIVAVIGIAVVWTLHGHHGPTQPPAPDV